jgi:hypothetical protein
MEITDYTENGKTYATVTENGQEVFRTASYYTERMAIADALTWVAFHGPAGTMTFGQMRAYKDGLAARLRMDAENTVTVSSGTHVLPWDLADKLRDGQPHPRHTMPGTMGARKLARQKMFKDVAALLGIPVAEAQRLPRMLADNRW